MHLLWPLSRSRPSGQSAEGHAWLEAHNATFYGENSFLNCGFSEDPRYCLLCLLFAGRNVFGQPQ